MSYHCQNLREFLVTVGASGVRTKIMLSVVSILSAALAVGHPLDRAWVKGVTDKDPLSYAPGEKMSFTLTVEDLDGSLPAGEYFLCWTRSGDDGLREEGKVPVDGKPFVHVTKIDKAGFVRLQAHVVDRDGKKYRKPYTGDTSTPAGKAAKRYFERTNSVFFDGGAGADVGTLRNEPEPKDFDAFWAKQFARLDRVPIRADKIEIRSPNPKARLYAVRVDCAGLRPVTGYLGVPKAVDEGKTFPARLKTEGYSGRSCTQDAVTRVPDDEIFFRINAHGLKLVEFGATEADTKALRWEIASHDAKASYQGYGFDEQQNADPEVAYFNGMVLRVKRALQYLKTLKGWNGRDLIASGGSQGGLQTVWAAGCGEGVTRAEPYVTWCCDMYTSGKLRRDSSLKLAADGWYVPWVEALGYYDAVNFGKRIPKTCRTVVTRAGLGDYCCPPTGLAKLWNAIPDNKEIHWMQGSQHDYEPPVYEGRDFVRKTADETPKVEETERGPSALAVAPGDYPEPPDLTPWVTAGGTLRPKSGHVQGACVTKDAVYMTLHNGLYKFDWRGDLLKTVPAQVHQGDICHSKGKLYVAVAVPINQAGEPEGRIDVYDADLNFVTNTVFEKPADGITCMNGVLYVGLGPSRIKERPYCGSWYGTFDEKTLKPLMKPRLVETGHDVCAGVQNICNDGEKLYVQVYTPEMEDPCFLVFDRDFNLLGCDVFGWRNGLDLVNWKGKPYFIYFSTVCSGTRCPSVQALVRYAELTSEGKVADISNWCHFRSPSGRYRELYIKEK